MDKPQDTKVDVEKSKPFAFFLHQFPLSIEEVARLMETSMYRHSYEGWRHIPGGYDRYTEAFLRHVMKEAKDEEWNSEDECYEIISTLANALIRAELFLIEKKNYEIKTRSGDNGDKTRAVVGFEYN